MTVADISDAAGIDDGVDGNAWSAEQIESSLLAATGRGYCIRVDSFLIGFALFSVVADEASLLNMGVASDYRRRGYARLLLAHSLEDLAARSVNTVHLEVRASNMAARSLYDGFGFQQTGIREGYYPREQGREDAVLMSIPWLDTNEILH